MPSDLYFGLIVCPAAVVEKINGKHAMELFDVTDGNAFLVPGPEGGPPRPCAYSR